MIVSSQCKADSFILGSKHDSHHQRHEKKEHYGRLAEYGIKHLVT